MFVSSASASGHKAVCAAHRQVVDMIRTSVLHDCWTAVLLNLLAASRRALAARLSSISSWLSTP
jgi:hypothetical protein